MVAQPQSSSTKPAPLSYADRARNHSKTESLPPKPAVNGVSANTSAGTSGPSKPATTIKVSPPNPKHPASLSAPSMRQTSTSNPSVRSTETNSTLLANGHPPTINGHPSPASEAITPPHPPVNVWEIRKEQMAQTATQRSGIPPAKDSPSSVASQDRDSNTSSGLRDGAISVISSTDGPPNVASGNDDPFIIKPRHWQPPKSIPPVGDKESWPEVGSSVSISNGKERVERAAKLPQDSSKKEKRKWVPAGPEFQAPPDTVQPRHHRIHPRTRSQSRNNDGSANASSGSGEVSQRSSRPHSVRTSASHSRVSSRTGSVHTSPRFNPANRSLYDTPEVSPPIPYPEAPHNPRYLHPKPPSDSSMNNPYLYSYSPVEGSSTSSPSQHYYSGSAGYESHPLPYPPPHIPAPPHFHHVSHNQQSQPGPGHTYPHISQSASHRPPDSAISLVPLQPPQEPGESRIPLPTMLTRPPPPEHSAAVDGYRDVTAALSAVSLDQHLVFGGIQPQTTEGTNPTTPSPEPVANTTDETTRNAAFEPRLPPFTVGVSQGGSADTVKSRKHGNALKKRDPSSAGDSSSGGIVDRTGPEATFQFGSLPSLDVASGSTSERDGTSDQAAPAELDSLKSDTGDEWQVRDFGYGFGHMSGTGNAAAVVRDEINAREQRRFQERRQREEQERKQKEEGQEREIGEVVQERPQRGSFSGGYERGGYTGRRGRGLNGGYGRGYGRNISRGGYNHYPRHQHQYSPTPPTQLSQLPPHATHGYSPDQGVYFLPQPPPPNLGPYHPAGYDMYPYPFQPPPALFPPVPHPISQLPFPLDHTRFYLLGQLEYYLSPQNMAQDFYLRQQMNPDGWISIPLLASFNRIRQLTPDPQLVRDVLTLSSAAEVSGDWVRMGGNQWTQFVLPPTPSGPQSTPPETGAAQESAEEDGNVEEDDDDDVEFFMG